MDALQKLVATAGQTVMEDYYGAMLQFFGNTGIPCTASKLEKDFDLVPGGQSPKNFIETVTFLKERAGPTVPRKGVMFSFKPTAEAPPVAMQFWNGGLLPDGLTYQFMAVDANYRA